MFGEGTVSDRIYIRWFEKFETVRKFGHGSKNFDRSNKPRSGRTFEVNCGTVKIMLDKNRCLATSEIAGSLRSAQQTILDPIRKPRSCFILKMDRTFP